MNKVKIDEKQLDIKKNTRISNKVAEIYSIEFDYSTNKENNAGIEYLSRGTAYSSHGKRLNNYRHKISKRLAR